MVSPDSFESSYRYNVLSDFRKQDPICRPFCLYAELYFYYFVACRPVISPIQVMTPEGFLANAIQKELSEEDIGLMRSFGKPTALILEGKYAGLMGEYAYGAFSPGRWLANTFDRVIAIANYHHLVKERSSNPVRAQELASLKTVVHFLLEHNFQQAFIELASRKGLALDTESFIENTNAFGNWAVGKGLLHE